MTAAPFDPRLTPGRRDLAAASLQGKVDAERFVEGERFTVLAELVDLRRRPRPDAPLDTQLLYGETVTVYDDDDGWGWVQADRDGYVGYLAMSALGRRIVQPTHHVVVNRTFVYPAADMKQPPTGALPLGGSIHVEGRRGDFVRIHGHGFVFAGHVAPLGESAHDVARVADRLVGVPYLWGGKSAQGIDCSGLVQLAFAAAGRVLPRDTDMQEALGSDVKGNALNGNALACDDLSEGLQRGDLVFWKGHVGILADPSTLIHANAHHMLVAREPLNAARERIMQTGLPISSIRRLA